MAYGSNAFRDELGRRDMTTIRGVDTTERIFYISPHFIRELLIRNDGTYNVYVRLGEGDNPLTIKPGEEANLSGEIAYFLASSDGTQNIDILYRPTKKLIATKVPPIGLAFDGVDDNVIIPGHDATHAFSIEVMLKFHEKAPYGVYEGIVKKFGTSEGQYVLAWDSWGDKISAFVWYGTSWRNKVLLRGVSPSLQKTNFIQLTAEAGESAYLFQNGELYGSTSVPSNSLPSTEYDVNIGSGPRGWFGASRAFSGVFYMFRSYNRALNKRELKHNHQNPYIPVEKGLVSYLSPYSIDIVNSTWHDMKGNAHGTILGARLVEVWRPEQ
ncbi:LamG-like jellyroll fold domain-containing protein [Thermococcus sp.]